MSDEIWDGNDIKELIIFSDINEYLTELHRIN